METTTFIDPVEAHALLASGEEVATLDVRDQASFGTGHLLIACNVPLGELEVRVRGLVPRLGVPVILCDADAGEAPRASALLRTGGYTDVRILRGGVSGWQQAGYELFSGVNVPSKAFGEYVEHRFDTPRIEPQALKSKLDAGEDLVILDSRPATEFEVMSIPGGIDTPGAELVYRVRDLAPDPSTTVIVNCAGRTRSIIGCQSLVNAGIPNPVTALKDGTMGWHLAGLELERGSSRRFASVSEAGLDWARDAARRVAERFNVRKVSPDTLARWREQAAERTLYVFDVRQPDEFESGHLPGSSHAAGGQLVQATDTYLAVRNARVVLVDDTGVRATMTASWLNQMGLPDVYVLDGGFEDVELAQGGVVPVSLCEIPSSETVGAEALRESSSAVVVDVRRSLDYRAAHIPGARWGMRSCIDQWASKLVDAPELVVVAAHESIANLTASELRTQTALPTRVLDGGMAAWNAARLPVEQGLDDTLCEPADAYHRPYDRETGQEAAMQAYLDWEVALVDQINRDATLVFPDFD